MGHSDTMESQDVLGLPTHIKRTQVPYEGDATDSDSIRVYFDTEAMVPLPSVTTIKEIREDAEKEKSLEGWRNHFDGKSQYSRPWYKDQMAFKGFRGTLIHFAILDALDDASGSTYFHEVGDDGWGFEEYYAEYNLKKWSLKAPSANTDEIPYSPRANKYDGEHAWDRAVRDMKWATRTFKKEVIDREHLDPDTVIGVEEYVYQKLDHIESDVPYGFGGQFDLLYRTDDGRVILSDLKTSSGIRFDNKLQSAAYKMAVEAHTDLTVDETEIIRLYPDKEEVEISRSSEWNRTLDGLAWQFKGLLDEACTVEYRDALERAIEQMSQHSGRQIELAETTMEPSPAD